MELKDTHDLVINDTNLQEKFRHLTMNFTGTYDPVGQNCTNEEGYTFAQVLFTTTPRLFGSMPGYAFPTGWYRQIILRSNEFKSPHSFFAYTFQTTEFSKKVIGIFLSF